MSPEILGLSRVDFITIGTVGPPGHRTFYLQGAQGDLLVSDRAREALSIITGREDVYDVYTSPAERPEAIKAWKHWYDASRHK